MVSVFEEKMEESLVIFGLSTLFLKISSLRGSKTQVYDFMRVKKRFLDIRRSPKYGSKH